MLYIISSEKLIRSEELERIINKFEEEKFVITSLGVRYKKVRIFSCVISIWDE